MARMTTETTTTEAPAPAPAAGPATPTYGARMSELAHALYPEPKTAAQVQAYGAGPVPKLEAVSPELQALRDADGLASVNLEGSFRGETADIRSMLEASSLEATPQQIAAGVLEFKAMAHDLQVVPEDVTMLTSMAKAAIAQPPTEQEVEAQKAESMAALRAAYPATYDKVLADTKQLVQRDPRVADFLNRTMLGSNPRVVMRLAELAVQARSRGRLK